VKDYVQFLYNQEAVILVLIYMYLPYAILPLYSTIDKFDFSLLEAARDLGDEEPVHDEDTAAQYRSGIFTAVLFTFIPYSAPTRCRSWWAARIRTCSETSSPTS
jgi:spermidine/putrescine transport system permease protein